MNSSVCIIVALVILEIFLIAAFDNRHNANKGSGYVLAGILLSSLFLFLPYYWEMSRELDVPLWRALCITVYDSIKSIGGGHEISKLENAGESIFESERYRQIYLVLNYSYLVAGPILTSSLLISMVGDFLDRVYYYLSIRRNYHIFSDLNENSLQIAKQLRKKGTVVFCNTKDAEKVLISQAREWGCVILHSSCESLGMPFNPFKNKNIRFYLINPEEDQNLASAEQLILLHRSKQNPKIAINAFAESGTGIQVVESMEKGNLAVRFIDITALLCNNLLMKYPLYDLQNKSKDISVMIVGCDRTGMRMLKTIAWCGILDGHNLKIRVYDKNAKSIEDKFHIQCPEKLELCTISFVEVDAETAEFEKAVLDEVKGSADATYVVMAMGEDEKNIAVADRLFRLFRYQNRFDWTPHILVRIRSTTKSGVYLDRENKYLKARNIHLFGSMKDVFAENTLFHTYLERLAFAVDLCYNGKLPKIDPASMKKHELKTYLSSEEVNKVRSTFTQNEYNRRSSMATALHIPSKLHSCGVQLSGERPLTDAIALEFRKKLSEESLLTSLAKNEHSRWNNFMRSEGYSRATEEDFRKFYPLVYASKDKLSKRHFTLAPWKELKDITDIFNELDWPEQKKKNPKLKEEDKTDFVRNDKDIISNIPVIIALANQLEKTGLDEMLYL